MYLYMGITENRKSRIARIRPPLRQRNFLI